MSNRQSYILFAIIVVILALAFLIGYALSVGAVTYPEPEPSKWDKRILELDKEALDMAYRTQLQHLFAVWMKDETGQPQRIVNGARQARRAYIESATYLEKREKELER